MADLVWFRNDLRTLDNPALHAAREHSPDGVVGVFLVALPQWRAHDVGDRRLRFLRQSLTALMASLARLRIPLWIDTAPRFSDAPSRLLEVAHRANARAVYCNAEYPFNESRRDAAAARACAAAGIRFEVRHGGVILPPGSVLTDGGSPYSVFTPFKRRWLATITPDDFTPLPAPDPLAQAPAIALPDPAIALAALPEGSGVADPPAGEDEAHARLRAFLETRIERYHSARDFPALDATSRLSAHLSIGSLSARACLEAARRRNGGRLNLRAGANPGIDGWIGELVWREFYRHVVALFPHVSRGAAFRREMDALEWRHDPAALDAWKAGRTGYPLVDAGMRQLAQTGFMHNRLRMVTAMFLVKHLLIDWREGERHFMRELTDGDFAANNGGWQWSASTGTDAAPYFRIFNPESQARRFDPDGAFVRRFVPELADTGSDGRSGNPGGSYPEPIVDHAAARIRALEFFRR